MRGALWWRSPWIIGLLQGGLRVAPILLSKRQMHCCSVGKTVKYTGQSVVSPLSFRPGDIFDWFHHISFTTLFFLFPPAVWSSESKLPHICFSIVTKVGAQPVTVSFHAFKADFWVLTSRRFVGWHYCYREICCFYLQDFLQCLPGHNSISCEDRGSIFLWNIVNQKTYTVSKPRA